MPASSPHAPAPRVTLPIGPAPLYFRLRQAIRERIVSGEWAPGQQIPTIRELCTIFGVSRITVVEALGALAQEGLISRQQGRGIFVTAPKVELGPVRLTSFTEETIRRGHVASSRLLGLGRLPAPTDLASKLEVDVDEMLVTVERLRLASDEPMGHQTCYLPERYVPGLADIAEPFTSLYGVLRARFGLAPTSAVDTYEPACADQRTASLLGVDPGAPVFAVERITRDQRGRVIELVRSRLRGDRYSVVLKLESRE